MVRRARSLGGDVPVELALGRPARQSQLLVLGPRIDRRAVHRREGQRGHRAVQGEEPQVAPAAGSGSSSTCCKNAIRFSTAAHS